MRVQRNRRKRKRQKRSVKRRLTSLAVAAVVVPLIAGCSTNPSGPTQNRAVGAATRQNAKHGPTFPECGGVSDQTVSSSPKRPGW